MARTSSYFSIYVLVSTIVIVSIFEFVLLPRYYDLPRDIALIGFTATPNTLIDDTSINKMGFTGDMMRPQKETGTIRILTLGGSAMFNRRMTERLNQSLSSLFDQPVEILGAALRTHTSMSSLIKYRTLRKYQFDYVIIYHGINDLFVNNVDAPHFKDDYSHMNPWYKRSFILDRSLTARTIYNNFIWGKQIFGGKKIWFIYPEGKNENNMAYVSEKLFKRNMTSLIHEIQKDGGIPVLMSFAWNLPVNYSHETFLSGSVGYASTNFEKYPVELWGSPEYVSEGLRRHNNVIRQIALIDGALFIDQESLMGKELLWFEDVCHFSDEGTVRFILNITDFFREQGLFKSGSMTNRE